MNREKYRRLPGMIFCTKCKKPIPKETPICRCGAPNLVLQQKKAVAVLIPMFIIMAIGVTLYTSFEKKRKKSVVSSKKVRRIKHSKNLELARIRWIFRQEEIAPSEDLIFAQRLAGITRHRNGYATRELFKYINSPNSAQQAMAISALGILRDKKTKNRYGQTTFQILFAKIKNPKLVFFPRKAEALVWALGWFQDSRTKREVLALRLKFGPWSDFWEATTTPYGWIPHSKKAKDLAKIKKMEMPLLIEGILWGEQKKGFMTPSYFDVLETLVGKNRGAYLVGQGYLALGDWKKALESFQRYIQFHPQKGGAYLYRGIAYFKLGQAPQAEFDFRRALSLNPKLVQAHLYLGRLLKKGQESTFHFQKYISRSIYPFYMRRSLLYRK